MSLLPPICTCDRREHACSPPCKAHPEKGGGLGNPGIPPPPTVPSWQYEAFRRWFVGGEQ